MKLLKTREQDVLAFALSLAAATALFQTWPQLDLAVADAFHERDLFVGLEWTWARLVYRGVPWAGALLLLWGLVVVLRAGLRGRRPPMFRLRRAALLLLMAVFGIGLLVHAGFKDQWGRPRPGQVTQFQGKLQFQPALQISSQCPKNCSFVSGHAAGGFALMVLGALGARRTRWRWWLAGTAAGGVVGLARMAQGGHFASDIVFALLAVWGVTILLRHGWLVLAALGRRRRRAAQAGPAIAALPASQG